MSLKCEYTLCPPVIGYYLIFGASYLMSLCFSDLFEKMGIMVSPLHDGLEGSGMGCKVPSTGPGAW